jgi:hypothetical protein
MVHTRKGIVSVLGELVAVLLIIGTVWGILYYGMIQPMLNTTPNYPGAFPSTMVTLMGTGTAMYMAFMTFMLIYYLWQQSRKREGYTY